MIITKDSVDDFRKDFEAAIEAIQEKYDVTVDLGNITYYPDRFSARLEVKNGRDADEVASADFDANVWKFEYLGYRKGMYMQVVIGNDGEQYALERLNVRAKKYPIEVIRLADGMHYKVGTGFIKEFRNEKYVANMINSEPN